MEFIVGNFEFELSKKYDNNIFYSGNVDIIDGYLVAFDGYFISKQERDYSSILDHLGDPSFYKDGVYNIVIYSRQKKNYRNNE